jgi:hypothetical protein
VDTLVTELFEGKKILEETFGVSIDTIVAPHDRFSRDAMLAIERVGYAFVSRGFAPLPREIRWWNIFDLFAYLRLVHYYFFRGRSFRYPFLLRLRSHHEIFNYRIEGQDRASIDAIIRNIPDGGVLPMTLHHRTLTVEQRDMAMYLLDACERASGYENSILESSDEKD